MSNAAQQTLRRITVASMNGCNFRYAKFVIVVSLAFTLLVPTAVYGYATNFNYATNAKWSNNLNFMLCIANSQPKEYEGLVLNAVDEWKSRWPHFAYTVSYASGCHINVHIVKTHSSLTDHGYLGHTTLDHWTHGAITKADIILPTYTAGSVSPDVLVPMSETLFYRAALHEFGHALNLGHFDDNGEEPIDIMYPYPADDDQEQGISQRDIQALNWYYLGFFDQGMRVRTDKMNYETGDIVRISGNVGNVITDKMVSIDVFADKKLYTSDNIRVGSSGAFAYELKLPHEMKDGSYTVKTSYNGAIVDTSFEIENSRTGADENVTEVKYSDMPFATDKKITVLNTQIVDYLGSEVLSVHPYEQVFIRSSISSNIAEETEATYIIQVQNSEGYTVEISSATYKAASLSKISHSWLPDAQDVYDIQIFLWNSSVSEPLIPNPITMEVNVHV